MTQINLSKSAMATIAACVIGTAGSVAWFGTHRVPSVKVSVEIDPNNKTQVRTETPDKTPAAQYQTPIVGSQLPADNSVTIYRTEPTQNGFKTVPQKLPPKDPNQSVDENLRAAFAEILAGNRIGEKAASKNSKLQSVSTIPPGTRLLSLQAKPDGVHLNLSHEFGDGGGSMAMQTRLAEVLATATSHDPNANVWISIEGEELKVLGGEGLEVPRPLNRKTFREAFESQQQ